ncbi:MAG: inositol monophosphatase [Sedimentisphaerales bacterium]|nr:inositol monophosphatase [Sedimentisphaerales bacterium]MBN2844059.1 inositol monophosphatase [Sedimentisphaerales bacterium]
MVYSREVEIAKKAARQAGDHALKNIAAQSHHKQCDNSIVTEIDIQCQAMIISALQSEFPEYGIIGEEPEAGSGEMLLQILPKGDKDIWWVIDPIDGTRNFAFGLPFFAVSIGLIVDGMPAAGVIYYPDRQEMYFAASAEGPAYCNDKELTVKEEKINPDSQICVSGLLHEYWSASQVEKVFHRCVHANLGSAAIHMAYLAAGKYSAGIFLRTKFWDIAGGAAILLAAGGVITDFGGKDIFPFDCSGYGGKPVKCLLGGKSMVRQIADLLDYQGQ